MIMNKRGRGGRHFGHPQVGGRPLARQLQRVWQLSARRSPVFLCYARTQSAVLKSHRRFGGSSAAF